MAKSEIEFSAEQIEKMTELLRNGILVAINEDNTYLYSDVVDYMIAHGATIPVRCKDCIGKAHWYKNDYGCTICGLSGLFVVEDRDFCPYGERREGE